MKYKELIKTINFQVVIFDNHYFFRLMDISHSNCKIARFIATFLSLPKSKKPSSWRFFHFSAGRNSSATGAGFSMQFGGGD